MAATSIPAEPRKPRVPADETRDADADPGSGKCNGFGMVETFRQKEAEPVPP
jgi:hypothetical protein